MVLETCQLLNNAVSTRPRAKTWYRTTHLNHPCSKWVAASSGNYNWTVAHFKALLAEYTRRYGKVHKCADYLPNIEYFRMYPGSFEVEQQTPFVNCTTDYKHLDVFMAYKLHLNDKWDNDKREPSWEAK